MGIGGQFIPDFKSDQDAVAILRLAFDQGMTLVDTAEVYASGHSEELVAGAIEGRRDYIYVATKVSPENLSSGRLTKSLEGSLKRLRTDRVDLYQVHWPNPQVPIQETMETIGALVKAGKVRHIGISNFSLHELKKAESCLGISSLAAVQVEYNLFDRSIEHAFLPYCQQQGITVVAYSPLDQGHICGGPNGVSKLASIAERYNCSAAQLALAWLIRQPGVVVIPKAAKFEHVLANAAAGEIELSPEDSRTIDRITASSLVDVPVDSIRVVAEDEQRKVYRTLEEAKANIHGLTPSPMELARQIISGEFLKAVRVRPTPDPGYKYDLIEGRLRYWAWVIAFDGKRDIPVLVRE